MRSQSIPVLVMAVLLFGSVPSAFATTASFQGLGDLSGGSFFSLASDVSADGSTVVGRSSSASGSEAFRWTSSSGMVGLGDLPGGSFSGYAEGVSADGSIVVGYSNTSSGFEAFRWTSASGMVGLGYLYGGSFRSQAEGISADGSTIVGMDRASDDEAFRWTSDGGMVGLGDLAGGDFDSHAYDVSADGSTVVGRSISASGFEAFRWTSDGGMVGLGDLAGGSFRSRAYGVSADGSIVVGYSESASGFEAFRWTSASGMVGLGDLAGGLFDSCAYGVSADGSTVVGTSKSASGHEAFIWDTTNGIKSLRDVLVNDYGLDLTGWALKSADGISDDGLTIAGYGDNPDGDYEAWIVRFFIVYYVDAAGGSDLNDGLTPETAFATIQKSIDTAQDGDTVIVHPGQYLTADPEIEEQIDFGGKNITLTSTNPADPNIVSNTIIGGTVLFDGTEDPNCTLTGFTIRHVGYGRIVGNGTQATISHCNISGNAPCGAAVMAYCDGTISNCLITDNTTGCSVNPVVFGCHGLIKNCTIANNVSGILVLDGRTMTLENCIIYNNDGFQLAGGSGATLNISYCNIQGGAEGIAGEADMNWGPGNIDADPCFVRLGYWNYDLWPYEFTPGDYHLKSEGWRWSRYIIHGSHWTYDYVTSRCIDAGNPGSPLGDELLTIPDDPNQDWGVNLRVNMGYYGGMAQASMPPYNWTLLGDLSNDGTADFVDFAGQAKDWLITANEQPGDLNRDGMVNREDFAALAQDWLQTTDWFE